MQALQSCTEDDSLRPATYKHPWGLSLCPHLDKESPGSVHPQNKSCWEEVDSTMAWSVAVPAQSCLSSTASMKVKNVKKLSFTKGHFPTLAECAHFHYDSVDFGTVQLAIADEQNEVTRNGFESKELVYLIQISHQGQSWIVKRSYEDFRVLDKHLHLCIFDRRFSQLPELPRSDGLKDQAEAGLLILMAYLTRLSAIADNKINCGPVLTWMEIDNKGNHLLGQEESSINVPAIAAAYVVKRYVARAPDELSFQVGGIVSVIDMPPKEDTTWWRGKHGFQVGFFPSECVELINEKVPQSVTIAVPRAGASSVKAKESAVSKKHGKMISFLRTYMKSRPAKQRLKQRGIHRERVFGCDLGELLLNSGQDVPEVVRYCTQFIEKHGVVNGIYRLSGIATDIQKLRHEFDSEQNPDLSKDVYLQNVHCVGSLCKLYFRELPNPLLTYQLYDKFSEAVSAATDEERLVRIHDVVQQLPPPHYRTLEFLMRHLSHLATFSHVTEMHIKNLAIVWAPNLIRSRQVESACFSSATALLDLRIQSVVVEFILNHVDVIFSSTFSSLARDGAGDSSFSRPKSLLISSPSTKLLSLKEAQARTQAQSYSQNASDEKYVEVGEGPAALMGKFHTVIEFPTDRKRSTGKSKKSPMESWRTFFSRGKCSSVSKRRLHLHSSVSDEMKTVALDGGRGESGTLRSAKSEESLTSLHNMEGESKVCRPCRPRSSSDALSNFFSGDMRDRRHPCDGIPQGESEGDEALVPSPWPAEIEDLSFPDSGMACLDFDPMSFQCSFASAGLGEAASPMRSISCAAGSESISLSQDKAASPILSPALSPVLVENGSSSRQDFLTASAEKAMDAFSSQFIHKIMSITISVSGSVDDHAASPPSVSHSSPLTSTPLRTSEVPVNADCPAGSQNQTGVVALDTSLGLARSVSHFPPDASPKITACMLTLALSKSLLPPLGTLGCSPPYPLCPLVASDKATGRDPSIPPASSTIKSRRLAAGTHFTTAITTQTPAASSTRQINVIGSGDADFSVIPASPVQLVTCPSQVSPPLETPERNQLAVGQVPTSSSFTTDPVNDPGDVRHQDTEMLVSGNTRSPILSKPGEHSVTGTESQLNASSAQVTPISSTAVHAMEKPREAIPPVNQNAGPVSLHNTDGATSHNQLAHCTESRRVTSVSSTEFNSNMPKASLPASVGEAFKPYQQSSLAEYHITQLQPYFEKGQVQYRYSPRSGGHPLAAPCYCDAVHLRRFQSFTSRNLLPQPGRAGIKAGSYHYLSGLIPPPGNENSFLKRAFPPQDMRGRGVCLTEDPSEFDKLHKCSTRQESRGRLKTEDHRSKYDTVEILPQRQLRNREMIHLHSRPRPGKPLPGSLKARDGRYGLAAVSQPASMHVPSDPELLQHYETKKHNQPRDKLSTMLKPSSSKTGQMNPAQHLYQTQPQPQRQERHLKLREDNVWGGSSSYRQENPEAVGHPFCSEHLDQDRGYSQMGTGKSEQSQSVGDWRLYCYSRPPPILSQLDFTGTRAYQPHGKRNCNMTVLSSYDNPEDYPAGLQPERGAGSFPPQGCTPSPSYRMYSTALGQGAFLPSEGRDT